MTEDENGGPYDGPLVQRVLGVLHDVLGFEVTMVARIDGDRYEVLAASDRQGMGLSAGIELSLRDTF